MKKREISMVFSRLSKPRKVILSLQELYYGKLTDFIKSIENLHLEKK